MRTPVKFLLAFIVMTTVFSCSSSLKVTNDYDKAADFSTYKTFGFYKHTTEGSVSELNANRIMNAIRANLTAKGYTEQNSNPDMLVNAVTILKDKQAVSATTNYYGYGGLYRPYGYWGGGMATGYTTVNTYNYKDGSLSIDIVDNKTNKMVWQGIGNKDIDKAPKDPDATITDAVTKIMAGFPPGAKK